MICELSGNYNGRLDRTLTMIDAAAEAGCDAINIQIYTADTISGRDQSNSSMADCRQQPASEGGGEPKSGMCERPLWVVLSRWVQANKQTFRLGAGKQTLPKAV